MTDAPEIKVNDLDDAFVMEYTGVAPFPTEKFLTFLSHLKVQSKDFGLVPFKLLGSQRYLLREIEAGLAEGVTTFVILKARQLGISSFFLALDMYWAFAHKGLLGVFITHKEEARDDFRSTVEVFFAETPTKYRINYVRHNRNLLILKNASKFRYLIAGTGESRKGGLGRGGAANFVHATECAFYGNGDDLAEFRSQTSSLYPHRLQIYETTANGFNHFNDMWEIAKADPTKRAIFIGWWRDERNQLPVAHPFFEHYMPDGIRTALLPLERKRVRLVREQYNYEISLQQIAWYRWHLATEKDGDQSMMDQEFPYCVVAGTRVGTTVGLIPIEEVASHTGISGTCGLVRASGSTGAADIFKMKTAMGYELRGTGNHPIAKIESGEFIDLSESKGSTIILVAPRLSEIPYYHKWRDGPANCSVGITEDFARLVGIFMGDGSMQVNCLSIACDSKDQDVVLECLRLIKSVFGLDAQVREVSKGGSEVRITSKLIYETFKKMGLTRTDTGPTMRKVHVPEFIWRSPKNVVREFLRGLFEADGFNGYDTPRVVLFSKWPDFLKEVQLLLLAFGITCRRTAPFKISKSNKGKVHTYVGNELQLRKAESIAFNEKIGFLSARKRLKFANCNRRPQSDHSSLALELCDKVVEVVADGHEQVYNLSIEKTKLFDANGILTHNTEEDAFQATGSKFFTVESITDCMKVAKKVPFHTFRYKLGLRFEETELRQVKDPRAPLRIYEDASRYGYYALGCDPAYGSSDEADRTVISIWRCYADCIVQVAEYCSTEPSTYQCAWVLAHLAGYYGVTFLMPILEMNGPGQAVFDELEKVRKMASEIRAHDENYHLKNILGNMRHYFYSRMDSLSSSLVYQWKTSHDLKTRAMNQFKNGIELGRIIPRSLPLLEEMRRIENDQGVIAAAGAGKDDRVMAAALAYQAFNSWCQPKVKALGLTLEKSNAIEEKGGTPPTERVIQNYLKRMQITVPT